MIKRQLVNIICCLIILSLTGCAFTKQFALSEHSQGADKIIFPITFHFCATCYHNYPHEIIQKEIHGVQLTIDEDDRYLFWIFLIPVPIWISERGGTDNIARLHIVITNNGNRDLKVTPDNIRFSKSNGSSIEHEKIIYERSDETELLLKPGDRLPIILIGGDNYSFASKYTINIDNCFDDPHITYGDIDVYHRTVTTFGLMYLD